MTTTDARKRLFENSTVEHPPHYTNHPSGVECIEITEHMNFNLGNATKYIWRADEKGLAMEDLRKASWYIQREIERRERLDREDQTDSFYLDYGDGDGPQTVDFYND